MSESGDKSGAPNKKQRASAVREVSLTSSNSSSGLFHNLSFILCGLLGDEKKEMESLITSNNGVVIKSFPAAADLMNTSIIVITYPTGCRRPNYLLALALNIPLVHPAWIRICTSCNTYFSFEEYLIPTGSNKFNVYNISEHRRITEFVDSKSNQLFFNLNVINTKSNDKTIDHILSILGGNIIDLSKKYNFTSTSEVVMILVDSFDYNHKEVLSIYDKFLINSNLVYIVTIEWLVACLEHGYIIDFNIKPIDSLYTCNLFLPPTNVVTSPYCIKVESEILDTVERYSKYDIIKYFTTNNTIKIGQIIDIQRQDSSLSCHILPLHVNDKKVVENMKNLEELVIIEPEKIIQRVSLYTKDTYTRYKYTLIDDNIYCIN